jgi:hypothetical protein
MGMVWYKFYTYIFLPLGILGHILRFKNVSFHFYFLQFRSLQYPSGIPRYIFVIIALIIITINFILIFGLHFKKIWAWNLNMISLVLFILVENLQVLSNLPIYFCMILLYVGLWFIPNYSYFKRRKVLFG